MKMDANGENGENFNEQSKRSLEESNILPGDDPIALWKGLGAKYLHISIEEC